MTMSMGMKTKVWSGLVLAGALAVMPANAVRAQQAGDAAAATSTMTNEQLLPLTVHEAWVASGRNEDKFFAMVSQLAELSAQKRGVTLPNRTDAGERAGAKFKELARRDPDQLLYVVVDTMVRHVAAKQTAAAAPAPATK